MGHFVIAGDFLPERESEREREKEWVARGRERRVGEGGCAQLEQLAAPVIELTLAAVS